MNDQFYRKPKPTFGERVKRKLNKKSVLFTVLIGAVVLAFVTFSNRGIIQRLTLESQKREMQEKVRLAQLEQRRLQVQSKALDTDPKAIEKVAREKYGMVRDGETVYKVKKN
jgi:cell division protein FtsB